MSRTIIAVINAAGGGGGVGGHAAVSGYILNFVVPAGPLIRFKL